MVLKASPRRRLGVRALQVAGRPSRLAILAYGVRLPLFGVGGTPTTLWQTPCSRDGEVAARQPPKSFPRVEGRVPALYFPPVRCGAGRIGEG